MNKRWIGKPSPKSRHVGNGWFGELDRCFVDIDNIYCVMVRTVETEWGLVEHACIRNVRNTDIPWSEKQRIKDEIFGPERTAIEVFPSASQLVDEANMYHFWVLPESLKLPFSLKEGA
jgi:hypothetical protein